MTDRVDVDPVVARLAHTTVYSAEQWQPVVDEMRAYGLDDDRIVDRCVHAKGPLMAKAILDMHRPYIEFNVAARTLGRELLRAWPVPQFVRWVDGMLRRLPWRSSLWYLWSTARQRAPHRPGDSPRRRPGPVSFSRGAV